MSTPVRSSMYCTTKQGINTEPIQNNRSNNKQCINNSKTTLAEQTAAEATRMG